MQFTLIASLFAVTALAMPPLTPFGSRTGGCASIQASCKPPSPDFVNQVRKECAATYAASGNTADDPSLPSAQVNCQIVKILEAQKIPCQAAVLGSLTH
ncbi:hypothetical protein B0A55_10499 [Friedmanniomyces simplex]|uniref:Fungal calcium binding protein domain-containing protein n=1 Tax=Friedmanniomyces simplex TaxID=329884 RepID=A0A4U0WY46_9PEZI|nr:hypothetical protein B0A55_10499 [Friedmanniomyces simplex]